MRMADRHRPGPRRPTVIITNDTGIKTKALIGHYARWDNHRAAPRRDHPGVLRRRPVQRRQPQRRPRRRPVRPGPGPHRRLPAPPARQLRPRHSRHPPAPLPGHPGEICTGTGITIKINRRAYSPVLRHADTPVPCGTDASCTSSSPNPQGPKYRAEMR